MTGVLRPPSSPSPAPRDRPRPTGDDVQPCANEARDRVITGIITAGPVLALGLVGWQVWEEALRWSDLAVLALLYVLTGLGVTLGFHRLLTHRSFTTTPWMRGTLAALGSMAIEGPVVSWVADHRKHHAFSDVEGDPHSPHVGHGSGWRGALEALTLSLADELAPLGITVNAVNPGVTDTGWIDDAARAELAPKHPMGRFGEPDDAARLIAFLAGDEGRWITGQVLHSEGGFRRR